MSYLGTDFLWSRCPSIKLNPAVSVRVLMETQNTDPTRENHPTTGLILQLSTIRLLRERALLFYAGCASAGPTLISVLNHL